MNWHCSWIWNYWTSQKKNQQDRTPKQKYDPAKQSNQNSDFQNQINNLGQSVGGLENGQAQIFDYIGKTTDEKTHLYRGLNDIKED